MTPPLGSTLITRASSLLRAGPPARPATVLDPSRLPPLGTLPITALTRTAVSGHAFSRSTRKQQIRLASSTCRTPSGRSAGIRQTHPGTRHTPRFRCHLFIVTTLQRRFAYARLPDPCLAHLCAPFSSSLTTTVFSQRRMRGFEASPAGQLRRANLHLPRNTASKSSAYDIKLLSTFGTHVPHENRIGVPTCEVLRRSGC
jgi:hypothetical protein